MIEIEINLRSSEAPDRILEFDLGITFPLHPNYSTSVQVGGPLPLCKLFHSCAGPHDLGLQGVDLGPSGQDWGPFGGVGGFCRNSKFSTTEKVNMTSDRKFGLTLVRCKP